MRLDGVEEEVGEDDVEPLEEGRVRERAPSQLGVDALRHLAVQAREARDAVRSVGGRLDRLQSRDHSRNVVGWAAVIGTTIRNASSDRKGRGPELHTGLADGSRGYEASPGSQKAPKRPQIPIDVSTIVGAPAWASVRNCCMGAAEFRTRRLIRPSGTEPTPEKRCTTLGPPGTPVWSPDGRELATGAQDAVYMVNPDGTGRVSTRQG